MPPDTFPTQLPDLSACVHADALKLRRLWKNIARRQSEKQPVDRLQDRFTRLYVQSVQQLSKRKTAIPKLTVDESLPINQRRQEIADAIRDNQVVVICGETGSGKSTQLPQICMEIGRGQQGYIGHTQPRRLAARSIATRIASETKTQLGQTVGYKIRFGDVTSDNTLIKVMTDGILLAESQQDPMLEQYDTIIIDEAHERSLNVDFLLGYIKQLLPRRPDLKFIITSATIDPKRFSEHFNDAPVIEVSGRMFPVEVLYRPTDEETSLSDNVREALHELMRIGHGDVLVFLPTERDIRECAKELGYLQNNGTEILPLFARLSSADQMKVFNPTGKQRRVVLATNVAETSITVPGIRYVIDSGLARMSRYSSRAGVQRLPVEPISQASADQRKGRCGRVAEGVCIRLYSQEDYEQRDRYTTPEIMRTNLSAVILQMKALRLGPVQLFPFLDPPRPTMIKQGFKTLHELGAVNEEGVLSKIGWQLASFPVDPRVARMLIAGHAEDALDEILVLAAAMSVQDPRERPAEKREAADNAHELFKDESSDFLTLLNLWKFIRQQHHKLSRNQFRKCCKQNFLSHTRIREWMDVTQQLTELVREQKLHKNHKPAKPERIHRALLTGLLAHVAAIDDGYVYRGTGGNKLFIFPGSVLFKKKPQWMMAAELVETGKLYARTLAPIDPNWLEPLAGHLVKKSYNDPRWDRQSGRALVNEKITMLGLTIVASRRCPMDRYDKNKAREMFIHHALVEMDIDNNKAPFMLNNQRLLKNAQQMQAKLRRHDLLGSQQQRYDFFDSKLPADITNAPRFEKWRKKAEDKQPKLLFMKLKDFLAPQVEEVDKRYFPDKAEVFGSKLKLSYRADFGHEDDGVTASVPVGVVGQLDDDQLHKLVPGLLEQKINALLRALPKDVRRHYIPIAKTAQSCLPIVAASGLPLTEAICEALQQVAGFAPNPTSLDLSILPEHLQTNIRVVDARGKTLAKGRNLSEVKAKVGTQIGERLSQAHHPKFTKTGLKRWDFGDLPLQVTTKSRGMSLPGYPALVDCDKSVSLELMESEDAARAAHRRGLLRLFVLQIGDQLKAHVQQLPNLNQLAIDFATLGDKKILMAQLSERAAMMTFLTDDADIRTRVAFAKRFDDTWGNLAANVRKLSVILGQVLEARRQVDVSLEHDWPPSATHTIEMIRYQRDLLIPKDFITQIPDPWLTHLPRYLQAISDRLSKLAERRYGRDAELYSQLEPYERAWSQLTNEQQQTAAGIKFFWMLQEFYVALFAQHLGTGQTISAKRLDKQLAKAQRKTQQVTVKAEVSNTPQVKDAISDLVKKFGDPFA
tara:strand:+ start:1236 stop:5195 length:3960 start_codon:yes stop_codon:yes gene_type:complete